MYIKKNFFGFYTLTNSIKNEWILLQFLTTILIIYFREKKQVQNYQSVRRLLLNSLWPSDTIWWHRFGSKLSQVMACCLTAPNYYLNQCWLVINGFMTFPWGWFPMISIGKISVKITSLKLLPHLPRASELKALIWLFAFSAQAEWQCHGLLYIEPIALWYGHSSIKYPQQKSHSFPWG